MKFRVIAIFTIALFSGVGLIGVSAYQQPNPPGDPARGGKLYTAWDRMVAPDMLPIENQPMFSSNQFDINNWRCSTCHGWDYLGREGAYGNASFARSQSPGLLQDASLSVEELVSWLDGSQRNDHDFSPYLSEVDMNDLAAFISTGVFDVNLVIDPSTGQSLGTATNGEVMYKIHCRNCHGNEGATINFGTTQEPRFLGDVANNNPWRIAHILRYGHLETETITGEGLEWSVLDVADLVAYTQFLPKTVTIEREQAALAVDYSNQGDTTALVVAMFVMSVVIFAGVAWDQMRENIQERG